MNNFSELDRQEIPFDPLLDALVLLTELYNRPQTRDSLIAGLPVEDQKLDVDNFGVAAERGGLSTKLLKRSISSLSKLTMPALLLLKEKNTAILLDIDTEKHSKSNAARVWKV